MTEQEKAYLEAAATAIERQMMENPGVPVPVDPDVAAYMGAMQDDAMSYGDALEAVLTGSGGRLMEEENKKKPYSQQVAEEFIKGLEDGTSPLLKPWEPGQMPGPPTNAATGKPYRGINRFRLSIAQEGNIDQRWCTYKQAQDLGAQVKKGSKGTTVQYWQFDEKQPMKDDQGKPVLGEDGKPKAETVLLTQPRAFFATVFHASQIENLPPLPKHEDRLEWERHQQAEKLLTASGANIHHDQVDQAFYQPATDEIHLPPQEQFGSPDKYYYTALHEVGHWTGHESRLNRNIGHPFGSEEYAREELRAEIASYMLGADLGIGYDPGQHHAYVASWIDALKKDPREIFRAAHDAEQIREYVMGREQKQEQSAKVEPAVVEPAYSQPATAKTLLNVPFKEKDQAKAAGAKWDRTEKHWFAPEGTDLKALGQWLGDKGKEPPIKLSPVLNPREEFGQALRDAGLVLEGEPVMDGKIHRVPVAGGKKGAKDGAYCGVEESQRPNGWYQNHKSGEQGKWLATGQIMSPAKKEELTQKISEQLSEAEQARQAAQEKAQKRAYAKWMNSYEIEEHPYLLAKGITAYPLENQRRGGIEQVNYLVHHMDKEGNLLVPGYNLETGQIQTLQHISPAGGKWYERGCPKAGAVCMLPPEKEEKEKKAPEIVLVAEGFATGASLHQATGLPVAIAFDAGNLKEAALAIRKELPNAAITICADNDHNHPSGHNVGADKAKEAAAAVGGKVIVPEFSKEEKEKGLTDFNDLHQSRGLDAVAKAVGHKVHEAEQEQTLETETEVEK